MDSETKTATLGDFLREQRTNPYYVVFTVLFAAIITIDSQWIGRLVREWYPGEQSFGDRSLDALLKNSGLSVPRVAVSDTFTLPVLPQILLCVILFLISVYLWLFFSRIFVFVRETSLGEAMSFLLLFVLLAGVTVLSVIPKSWGLVLFATGLVVTGKTFQIYLSLRAQPNHPVRIAGRRWTLLSLGVTFAGTVIAILSNPGLIVNLNAEVITLEHFYDVVTTIGALLGVVIVAYVFPRVESSVVSAMKSYILTDEFKAYIGELPNGQ